MPKGQTPQQRRFRKETKPLRQTIRKAKQQISLTRDNDRLNDLRDTISNTMESFLNPIAGTGISGAAESVLKKLKPAKKEMSTGGEVDIDMTTEMDV
mgnify:FL=1